MVSGPLSPGIKDAVVAESVGVSCCTRRCKHVTSSDGSWLHVHSSWVPRFLLRYEPPRMCSLPHWLRAECPLNSLVNQTTPMTFHRALHHFSNSSFLILPDTASAHRVDWVEQGLNFSSSCMIGTTLRHNLAGALGVGDFHYPMQNADRYH